MRTFTLEQYKSMAVRFNRMSFTDKIETLRENKDILALGSDGNFWNIQVLDKEIQEELLDNDWIFDIENEWGSHEMYELVCLLGINTTDA